MADAMTGNRISAARPLRSIVSVVVSLALAWVPVAAQANSRASGATVSLVSAAEHPETLARMAAASDMSQDDCDNDGILNDMDEDDDCGGGLAWLVYGGVGLALLVIIFAAGSGGSGSSGGNGGGRSPGTGN